VASAYAGPQRGVCANPIKVQLGITAAHPTPGPVCCQTAATMLLSCNQTRELWSRRSDRAEGCQVGV
jgi:hypothetical protein